VEKNGSCAASGSIPIFMFQKLLQNLLLQPVCDLRIEPKPCRIGRCSGNHLAASAYVSAVISLSIYFIFPISKYFPGHLGHPLMKQAPLDLQYS